MKKENSNETQGKTSNNNSLTAEKTENTTRILSPMTGALSVRPNPHATPPTLGSANGKETSIRTELLAQAFAHSEH